MKIRPLADRIVVKRLDAGREDQGGHHHPRHAPRRSRSRAWSSPSGNGKVLKNGKVRPLDVKAGDRVLFGKYSGTEVKLDGDEHVILSEDDVLAVLS